MVKLSRYAIMGHVSVGAIAYGHMSAPYDRCGRMFLD
nr:MAG TPA: hypothetical protein [Caudoviricetes sp.]